MKLVQLVPLAAALALGLGLSQTPAHAGDAVQDTLAVASADAAGSFYVEYQVTTQEPGKRARSVGLKVWVKGDKRLLEYTGSTEYAGTRLLIASPTEVYLYQPKFGKVRRVASHTQDQSAFSLAYSPYDIATHTYANNAGAAKQLGSSTVTLGPGPTAFDGTGVIASPYAKVRVTLAKDTQLPTKLEYYAADGTLAKTETRSDYTCEAGECTPGSLQMVDHATGVTTTLLRRKWTIDASISDDMFSKRSLEK